MAKNWFPSSWPDVVVRVGALIVGEVALLSAWRTKALSRGIAAQRFFGA